MRVHINDGFAVVAVDTVTCNGFTQKLAIMADDELGCVERYKTDVNGNLLFIRGEPVREEISGRVKITFKKGWSMNRCNQYFYNNQLMDA